MWSMCVVGESIVSVWWAGGRDSPCFPSLSLGPVYGDATPLLSIRMSGTALI